MYLDANDLYGWAMSQNIPVSSFKLMEKLRQFNDAFIKNSMKTVIRIIFLK